MQRGPARFIVIIAVCFGLLPGAVAARSPSGTALITHDWTYFAIEDLVRDRGIPEVALPLELNRNQGALLVARLLQHLNGEDHLESRRFGLTKNVYLDSMIFAYNQRVPEGQALSAEQVELLYRLVLEFRQELEVLGYAIQDFNLLQTEDLAKKLDGFLVRQPLLYSEQVLAAARKAGEMSFSQEKKTQEQEGNVFYEQRSTPVQPQNLWTGQFSQASRYIPPNSILFARNEPESDEPQTFQIGGIEVSSGLRSGFADSQSSDGEFPAEGGAGYGISLRLGELALKTAVDLAVDPSLIPKAASTSLDLSYDWADLFTLSAGLKQPDLLKNASGDDDFIPVVTSLGLVVPIKRGQLHLGMTQEWGRSSFGEDPDHVDGDPPGDALLPTNIAELGLSYDFDSDSSLHINYRLIDFSHMDYGDAKTKAEAKFSIKF